ncbi:MAG: 23S rRNA (adenine(2503)-C(2))-methyltransferase RlmN [Candidatus Gracilibacteria bacterium]|jgi:23S rRNA (adenine2503-C2)-methyltransferase
MLTPIKTRYEAFHELFPNEKAFRWKQIEENLFKPEKKGWMDITNLSKPMREVLAEQVPWLAYKGSQIMRSAKGDTHKALLELEDGQKVETVLMENKRGDWTICVSSQVGCAMACTFCATGKMGLLRSLTSDEITDQYRFWQHFIAAELQGEQRISNVVFMGMGEPLANYENVKKTIHTWLKNTDLGPTHIVVSTVGVLPILEKILIDPDWPDARLAISLHSADPITRKEIVPSSFEEFIPKLKDWIQRYQQIHGNRRHHLSFEYVMLRAVNDTDHHAEVLADLVRELSQTRRHAHEPLKVNMIPYNFTDIGLERSTRAQIDRFKAILESRGVPVTLRKTMGDDIAAACGQLIVLGGKKGA